ncbi:MAG: hypothetical protein SNH79_07125 [Rikenellaceae bacterium]
MARIKKIIVVALFLLTLSTPVTAERDRAVDLNLNLGLMRGAFRDEQYSLINYELDRGYAIALGGGYRIDRHHIGVNIEYGHASATTDVYAGWINTYHNADLSLSYRYRALQLFEGRLACDFGLSYAFNFNGIIPSTLDNYAYIGTHNFSPLIGLQYAINEKHSLYSNFKIAILSLVARPQFSKFSPDENGVEITNYKTSLFRELRDVQACSVNHHINTELTLGYQYKIGNSFATAIEYRYYFRRYAEVDPYTSYANEIRVILRLNLH